jgi:hypothetical protein
MVQDAAAPVREAVGLCLAQFCDHLPRTTVQLHAMILPVIFRMLEDPDTYVVEKRWVSPTVYAPAAAVSQSRGGLPSPPLSSSPLSSSLPLLASPPIRSHPLPSSFQSSVPSLAH